MRRSRAAAAALSLVLIGCDPTSSPAPTSTATGGAATPSSAAAAPGCPSAGPASNPSSWRERVFYEIFVRSFADSDGDGIGDLAGLTARLDDLNDGDPSTTDDLGITGIWLMPVAEANSYHGYDVVDYTAVERDYGDMAAMRTFVDEAHKRGILVITDFVINHTSSDNPSFRDALQGGAHRDWYIWSDTDPGWPAVAGPNPWHPSENGFYYGAFSDQMPDLNLRNPEVTAELETIAGTWLGDVGVDGFRIDAAKHLIEDGRDTQANTPETKAWLKAFTESIHESHPDALVLGEVYDSTGVSSSYTSSGSLDMTFDFGIGPATAFGVYGDATTILSALDGVATRYEPGAAGTFLSNHDQARIATQLKGDIPAGQRAAAVLLTAPGVPFIYYGEELGMTGDKPDPRIRTPYPWTEEGPGFGFTTGTPWESFSDGAATANLATERADPTSMWATYRDLVQVRVREPALRAGNFTRVKASDGHVAAWLRQFGEQHVLVVHNLGAEALSNVALDVDTGHLCGSPTARVLYASGPSGAALPTPANPTITATGGLDGYVPLAELPPRSTLVVDISR